jgi:hypothetical protein
MATLRRQDKLSRFHIGAGCVAICAGIGFWSAPIWPLELLTGIRIAWQWY